MEHNRLTYSLGIGYPAEGLEWNESQNNDEYITGGPVDWQQKKMDTNYTYHPFSETKRIIKVIKI